MLASAMFENLAEDARTATLAGANGVAIGMGGEKVYSQWRRGQDTTSADREVRAAAQRSTLMRLTRLFGGQPGAGFRQAIKAMRAPE